MRNKWNFETCFGSEKTSCFEGQKQNGGRTCLRSSDEMRGVRQLCVTAIEEFVEQKAQMIHSNKTCSRPNYKEGRVIIN